MDPPILSYDEARALLKRVSDTLKASEAVVDNSKDQVRAARRLGWPDLSVNAIEVFGEKRGTIDGTPFGNLAFSENFRGPRSALNSTWSIYSGGRITATRRALAAGVEAANADLTNTEEDLDVLLAQVYFGLELAQSVERTRRAVLDEANHELERAVQFERHGLIPKVERLSAQVARDEAAREEVAAERDREIAEANLRRLLHSSAPIGTSTPLFVSTHALKPLTQWLRDAQRESPTLAALDARRDQAQQGVELAQSLWKPEIFAFGSYSLIHKYQTLIEPDWIAGVGVRFTLFSHEDRVSAVDGARQGLREAQSLEDAASTAIAARVESMYRKVEEAQEQFGLVESTLALAEENQRLRERGFAEGQSTTLDVNDARNDLAQARTERALAAYDYDIALVQLLQAAGQARALPDYIQHADIRLSP
ncbi:MAG TPA: TolC family protein [Steroidobacteraceae bacterium]|nr:TolC family protein [Steroidobacteraceae bacterium]